MTPPKFSVKDITVLPSQSPRLLDQVRATLRVQHYRICIEQTYMNWIKRHILVHDKPVSEVWRDGGLDDRRLVSADFCVILRMTLAEYPSLRRCCVFQPLGQTGG